MNVNRDTTSHHLETNRRRPMPPPPKDAFTLIELLVVIAIIVILAGLAFPAAQGALKSARKTEVRSMAQQIKTAIGAYYAEYGVYPSLDKSITDNKFYEIMTATGTGTNQNSRGIRFLEVPAKFIGKDGGIQTPYRFLPSATNFTLVLDTNYDGKISFPGAPDGTNGTIAVYVTDPDNANKYIGTW